MHLVIMASFPLIAGFAGKSSHGGGPALTDNVPGLLLTTDDEQLEQARDRFDLILDTISAPHDVPPLLRLAALDGTLSLLGYPGEIPLRIMDLIYGRKKLTSSGTGGRRGTAEMLAFAGEHGITADIELLPSSKVQEALDRLGRGDVRYRFVLDLSDLD